MTRKLCIFPDPNIDRQFEEIVQGMNEITKKSAVNANCTDLATAIALLNQIRAALIASKICS